MSVPETLRRAREEALTEVRDAATIAREETERRDRNIVLAYDLEVPAETIASMAGISRQTVWRIARRRNGAD
jgi:DNA invertase Pin-like site-specific DNA recombinase